MRHLALAALLAPMTAFAAGPTVEDISAPEVVSMMAGAGVLTEIKTDSVGDPLVVVKRGERIYNVLFYNCTEGRCRSIQFRTWWTTPKASHEKVNQFMVDRRYGRAYIDGDGDATLEMNIWLTGGVTREWLSKQHDYFVKGVGEFAKHIGATN